MMTVDQMIVVEIELKKSKIQDSAGISMKYSRPEHLVQRYILAGTLHWVKPRCAPAYYAYLKDANRQLERDKQMQIVHTNTYK